MKIPDAYDDLKLNQIPCESLSFDLCFDHLVDLFEMKNDVDDLDHDLCDHDDDDLDDVRSHEGIFFWIDFLKR